MRSVLAVICFGTLASASVFAGDAARGADDHPNDVRAAQVIETIVGMHIDPPTRQELALALARSKYSGVKIPVPPGLGRDASSLTSAEDVVRFLTNIRSTLKARNPAIKDLPQQNSDNQMMAAFGPLLGDGITRLIRAKDAAVEKQFNANRYVGIGIALSLTGGKPVMTTVFPGGPASKAGATDGTVIESIDGKAAVNVPLLEVIDRLRGPKGSTLELVVLKPGQEEAETVVMTRDVVPFKQLGGWSVDKRDETRVAYLQINRIAASTAQELQEYDQKMRDEQIGGLVLDLRETAPGTLHHAVLLADQLLASGRIGSVIKADGTRQDFDAHPDPLFDGTPIVILVERYTRGTTEWLAAALQDNHRAIVVGNRTAGQGYAQGFFPLTGTDDVLQLPAQILLRGNGTDLRAARVGMPRAGTRIVPRAGIRPLARQTVPGAVTPDHQAGPVRRTGPNKPIDDPARKLAMNLLHRQLAKSSQKANAAVGTASE